MLLLKPLYFLHKFVLYICLMWIKYLCVRACVSHQEELIMELVNDPNCKAKQFRHSYLQSTLVLILVTLMVRDLDHASYS